MNSKLAALFRKLTGQPDPNAAKALVDPPPPPRKWSKVDFATDQRRLVYGDWLLTAEIVGRVVASAEVVLPEEKAALLEADATIARLTALEDELCAKLYGSGPGSVSAFVAQQQEQATIAGGDNPERLLTSTLKTREQMIFELTPKKSGIHSAIAETVTAACEVADRILPRLRKAAADMAEVEEAESRTALEKWGVTYTMPPVVIALKQLSERDLRYWLPARGVACGSLKRNLLLAAFMGAEVRKVAK